MATTWGNRKQTAGIITPGTVTYRDQTGWDYPKDSGNTYEDSLLAELDDIHDGILNVAEDISGTAPTGTTAARHYPEALGFWVGTSEGTGTVPETARIPHGTLAAALKQKGVVLSINVGGEFGGHQMKDDNTNGRYMGQAHHATDKRVLPDALENRFGAGYLRDWDSDPTTDIRNYAQRILDGEYDTWIAQIATDATAWYDLTEPGETKGTSTTDKDTPYADYDDILFRFLFEMNGELGHSAPWADEASPGTGTKEDGAKELMAAFAYVSDRIRNETIGDADNAKMFYCFASVGDEKPTFRQITHADLGTWDGLLRIKSSPETGFAQYLGLDYYNNVQPAQDTGDDQLPKMGWKQVMVGYWSGTHKQYDDLFHIYDKFAGKGDIPMIIGEYGIG